ncbi:Alanine racemase, N-terminal domain family protein [Paenibacillus agaridevorans]|uniref:Alanine racemase, N-terminal domain family protein n=1 Tax=Paenibacillus agaridevorans TaxID=171404 RepID=A0A2R5EXQ5_9BACL|nr:alanine racemase [Paenibacillus agaridevorans]GBG10905.1 Alanine racemase, N-terminal domain family protein [Paenibacillus agaridevorans]
MRIEQMETPAVAIDLDILDANLKRTAELAAKAGVNLRPHIKTHKSVWIARKQIEYGAVGITVAKLGEAEVMADGGIDDILIAFPLVGAGKLKRLAALIERGVRVTVSVDSVEAASGISDVGVAAGIRIPLYLDINTGLNRCGLEPGLPSAELAIQISALPGVEVKGLMTHAGHSYGCGDAEGARKVAFAEAGALLATQQILRERGLEVPEISVGSTPTSKFVEQLSGVTEMRPGAYVFGDGSQLFPGLIDESECAMRIHATVVSAPRPGALIVDAGSKTLTSDVSVHRKGYGYLPDYPEIFVERLSEEHGILAVPDDCSLRIGDVLSIIPNHCCTVVNLRDELIGVRGGKLERMLKVDARGMNT